MSIEQRKFRDKKAPARIRGIAGYGRRDLVLNFYSLYSHRSVEKILSIFLLLR